MTKDLRQMIVDEINASIEDGETPCLGCGAQWHADHTFGVNGLVLTHESNCPVVTIPRVLAHEARSATKSVTLNGVGV
jgi:hypothetical protein